MWCSVCFHSLLIFSGYFTVFQPLSYFVPLHVLVPKPYIMVTALSPTTLLLQEGADRVDYWKRGQLQGPDNADVMRGDHRL